MQLEDKEFFIQQYFALEKGKGSDWRARSFVGLHERIKPEVYSNIKRQVLKNYPEARKIFETVEIKIGKEFSYNECSSLLKKLFLSNDDKNFTLMKKINIGFVCPDEDWKAKLTQFIFEELTTIFDYNEELTKLHNFIKTASWSLPIALFTSNSINIVNTVCSIASYYGVGLEVLRTDYQQSIKKHDNYYADKEIDDNIVEREENVPARECLSNDAAGTPIPRLREGEDRILLQKSHFKSMFCKDELEIDEKQITQNQNSIELIEKCAENGTWVLISTLKFPSFWYKISRKLEKLHKKGKVVNTFRLFFDLQGYSLQEIPESFLFNHSVKFYLTDRNNEDMEGFNDVWANILNDNILNPKDFENIQILEAPSGLSKIGVNLESGIYESSVDSLVPNSEGFKPQSQKHKKVKDDKIKYSVSSKPDSLVLPTIFTKEHLAEIEAGGRDLVSPRGSNKGGKQIQRASQRRFEDEISEIIAAEDLKVLSGMASLSGERSLLDLSRGEGALVTEIGQRFDQQATKPTQERKLEMVKKPLKQARR